MHLESRLFDMKRSQNFLPGSAGRLQWLHNRSHYAPAEKPAAMIQEN